MDRRKAMKVFAGFVAAGGAGAYALNKVFEPEYNPMEMPVKLEYTPTETGWPYTALDPAETGQLAYSHYAGGSCMYAIFSSFISQLADKFGEPYNSFPLHMMKYGRSGIGGYGTVCGALNGAAAVIGLLVDGNPKQDALITDLFRWYEKAPLPVITPRDPVLDFKPPSAFSDSTLCHASVTTWVNQSGYKVKSDERVERCRRLTGDVASRTAVMLNEYFGNTYVTAGDDNQEVRECMTCHGSEGKIKNTIGNMECSSCHTESLPHKVFANPHYKFKKVPE